ncbi:MAG: hypothetical protein ACREIW_08275, partial [Chthoniobacterales bacterium]
MSFLRIAVVLGILASFGRADSLRLRDGTIIIGNYVGGTQTEIWFQRSPAGAEAFPLFAIESVRFGNLIGSAAPRLPEPSVLKSTRVKVARKLPRQFARVPEPKP